MLKAIFSRLLTMVLIIGAVAIGFALSRMTLMPAPNQVVITATSAPSSTPTASETIPPYTPLPTFTPSRTLLPPPTFEPPTLTPSPSAIPSFTPTPTISLEISIPGLRGAETATPSSTPGCEPRADWQLIYTVQRDDSLARIAERYGTYINDLARANCMDNPDLIVIGQQLRVPGQAHPAVPAVECVPWELLTPMNGTLNVPGFGTLTFNWRGPRAPRNLIRIHKPDGGTYEIVLELRQNETIDLMELPLAGTYTWYVYPLDQNFVQVSCLEGGPWTFRKEPAPTPTPTIEAFLP